MFNANIKPLDLSPRFNLIFQEKPLTPLKRAKVSVSKTH